MLVVLVLGPAGSGKTLLTYRLSDWIRKNIGLETCIINFDPGVEELPYKPDYDVRRIFTLRDIMIKEGLGPNGAMIRSVELLTHYSEDIIRGIIKQCRRADIAIIDTPGQSEAFIFRQAGYLVTEKLKVLGPVVAVYLLDPQHTSITLEALVALLMSLVVQLKLDVTVLPVLNKSDLLRDTSIKPSIHLDLEEIRKRVDHEETGVLRDLARDLLPVLEAYLPSTRLVRVSAKTGHGIDELYSLIHEAFCVCGDLT